MVFRRWRKRVSEDTKKKELSENSNVEEEEKTPIKLSVEDIGHLKLSATHAEEEFEQERNEVYVLPPVQRLLRTLLLKGKKKAIIPHFDPLLGFRYEIAEEAFESDIKTEDIENLLEKLNHLQILKKDFFNTISACPSCNSVLLTLHFQCPKCSKQNIVRTGLTEHIPCGNIDERDKFMKDGLLVCPKCSVKLVKSEYRDMGLWYVCRACGERFERPNLILACRKCNNQFNVRNATIREIAKYALNWDVEEEIRQNVTSLESIRLILDELGFTVEMPAIIIGERSGIQHKFSLLAKKKIGEKERILVLDHAVEKKELGAAPLILFNYKISDISVDLPIFVAIPKLNETGSKIAQGQGILVIDGLPEDKEGLANISKLIRDRLEEKISKEELVHQWIFRKGKKIDVWRNPEGKFVKFADDEK